MYQQTDREMKQKLNEVDDNLRYLIEKLKKMVLKQKLA